MDSSWEIMEMTFSTLKHIAGSLKGRVLPYFTIICVAAIAIGPALMFTDSFANAFVIMIAVGGVFLIGLGYGAVIIFGVIEKDLIFSAKDR